MSHVRLWFTLALAIVGVVVCLTSLGGFLWSVATNNLPWHAGQSVREFYLEIGDAYAQGFTVGFFLCFFLVLGALSVSRRVRLRRLAAQRVGEDPPQPRLEVVRRESR